MSRTLTTLVGPPKKGDTRMYSRTVYRRPSALALVLGWLLTACGELPTAAGQDSLLSPELTSPTDQPFYSGAFLGDAESTPERIGASIREYTDLVGKRPALIKTFHRIDADFSARGWSGQLLQEVERAGATNYLAIDLRWSGAPDEGLLDAIAAGSADADLARFAREIRALNAVILLEPGWEMNGNWNDYAWQGVANRNDPSKFRAAWRHIVGVFRREGATNVRWVFNPNAGNPLTWTASGPAHWNWYGHYYPGDAYVDYIGAHGFNAPRLFGGSWQTFASLFDGHGTDFMLSDMIKRFPTKPIILGEFASDEASGKEKARWIGEAFARLRSHPNIVGAVWFHMDKETNWRVDSSPSALHAYREALADPRIRTAFRPLPAASPSLAGPVQFTD